VSAVIPRKSLGQHWLNDEPTLINILNLAKLSKDDIVLEIGPGLGSLTKLLVKNAKQVIAVELDSNLANQLSTFIHDENLIVVNESILKFDLSKLEPGYKIVANIPYYLTSNLLRLLSESNNPPAIIVLLVQKEVAQRVAARAGDMSLLSVTTQFYWEIELDQIVPASLFNPPPKVDSQVLFLKRRSQPLFEGMEDKSFFRLVKVGFSSRRKTLLNSLSNGLREEKSKIDLVLKTINIDSNTRPQMLSIDEWHKIYLACLKEKII